MIVGAGWHAKRDTRGSGDDFVFAGPVDNREPSFSGSICIRHPVTPNQAETQSSHHQILPLRAPTFTLPGIAWWWGYAHLVKYERSVLVPAHAEEWLIWEHRTSAFPNRACWLPIPLQSAGSVMRMGSE